MRSNLNQCDFELNLTQFFLSQLITHDFRNVFPFDLFLSLASLAFTHILCWRVNVKWN